MQIVLFEDELTDRLAPLACAEPAFAITCGGYKLIQLISGLGPECTLVRKHLARVEAETFPQRVLPKQPLTGQILFVNARMVPSIAVFQRLKALAEAGREGLVFAGEQKNVVAAALANFDSHPQAQGLQPLGFNNITSSITALKLPRLDIDLPLLDYPHDVLRHHLACCREDLEYRIRSGPPQSYPTAGGSAGSHPPPHPGYREVRDGVFVAENVVLGEHLVTDTKNGPIVIDHEATVGPFCFLRGPVYIGPCAKVNEHASLKDGVSLGHHTKVGGEVEGSIIEPFSNKQHHGFLGHSYVGSWVNIGAGTCNSDLKNTYGTVNMEYPAAGGKNQKVSTGLQFVGCFIGDYAKTAINTSIFTGKTIGVCSLVYGFVTTNVPSFCNYARSLAHPGAATDSGVTDLPVEVMISIQQRMFARRQTPQRECDIQLLRDLYVQAQQERQLPHEPPAL
jgi:UDP-N-acetylglucosamine diphosphorylase / glucose-1-phosphate thymidylyltransferase / UDP-N-acetylgalactosamine diphosphorylase / glucosamine-1-phosphate N-acetyltransferase / galactosamine-1-phosphate N-acetyltransferase